MPKEQGEKVVATNRKARHDYHIENTYEAGIVLTGAPRADGRPCFSAGDDLNIQYASTLSDLQDLDTVKAISLFAQQQFTLQHFQGRAYQAQHQ